MILPDRPTICKNELLPRLPNSVASHILARMPFTSFPAMRTVATSWRKFFSSPELWTIRKCLALRQTLLISCLWTDDGQDARLVFHVWDKETSAQIRLPPLTLASSHSFPYVIGLRLEAVNCKMVNAPDPAAFSQACPLTMDSSPGVSAATDDDKHSRPCLVLFGVERFSPTWTRGYLGYQQKFATSATCEPHAQDPWQLSSSCWCLDLTAGKWLPLPAMQRPRAHSFSCVTPDEQQIVTVGGIDDLSAIFARPEGHVTAAGDSSLSTWQSTFEFLGELLDLRTGLEHRLPETVPNCEEKCFTSHQHSQDNSRVSNTLSPQNKRVLAVSPLRCPASGLHLGEVDRLENLLPTYRRLRARTSPARGQLFMRSHQYISMCPHYKNPDYSYHHKTQHLEQESRQRSTKLTWQALTSATWPRYDPWLHISGCAAFCSQLFVFRSARTAKHWQADRVDVCLLPGGQWLGSAQVHFPSPSRHPDGWYRSNVVAIPHCGLVTVISDGWRMHNGEATVAVLDWEGKVWREIASLPVASVPGWHPSVDSWRLAAVGQQLFVVTEGGLMQGRGFGTEEKKEVTRVHVLNVTMVKPPVDSSGKGSVSSPSSRGMTGGLASRSSLGPTLSDGMAYRRISGVTSGWRGGGVGGSNRRRGSTCGSSSSEEVLSPYLPSAKLLKAKWEVEQQPLPFQVQACAAIQL